MKLTNSIIIIFLFANINILAQNSDQQVIQWASLANSKWPMSFNNPQATGRTEVVGPKTPNILWKVNKLYGTSNGPVIGNTGTLYFGTDYNQSFFAIDPDTTLIWQYDGGRVNFTAGGIVIDANENIYFGSGNDNLYSLDQYGNLNWKFPTEGDAWSPMINIGLDTTIYFTSYDNYLYAVNNEGNEFWRISIESGFKNSAPVISPEGETIYICGADSNLYALNLDSTLKWNYSCPKVDSVPIIDSQGNIYIIYYIENTSSVLKSIKPDGSVRWEYSFENESDYPFEATPCIDSNGSIMIANREKLIAIDFNGRLRWEDSIEPAPEDIHCPLACDAEGKVYFGCTFGTYYYCYSNDGDLLWYLLLEGHEVDNSPAFGEDGTLYIGVHKGPNKYSMLAIKDSPSSQADDLHILRFWELLQNFPNPFNPTTTIKFTIPESSFVSLRVYDLLGNEITKLISEFQLAGGYEITFNGSDLPSGVYFYNLTTGSYTSTKKMLLLK